MIVAAAALPLAAQYPGRVAKNAKASPDLRAIGVLEWTGDAGKPKASRLVPVAVFAGGELQDGSVYMARPAPMAVAGEVEYILLEDGKPFGLYDIKNAGQEQGSWVGYGAWKPMPAAKPKPSMEEVARSRPTDDDSDRPTLHRKKHGDEGAGGGSQGTGSSEPAAPADPDRPTLHRNDSGGSGADTGAPAAGDPARPTVQRTSTDGSDASSGTPSGDPDRPTLKRGKRKPPDQIGNPEVGNVESLPGVTDPDRPSLKRGKANVDALAVLPSLMGLPSEMQQAVAVSDAKDRPVHPWSFSWASPADEAKMKSALEEMARDALGLKPPPPPPAPAPKRTASHKSAKPVKPPPPPPPIPLEDEQFRVFELAYGSGATMVLSAHTAGPFAKQKFVTLVAQPDLYGNVLVLLKNVTDGSHLDEKPRMKLIDAVDALADNRGELLFELRGESQRQFALYRVLRGQADRLFLGGGGSYGIEDRN